MSWRLAASPWPYAAWALVVAATLALMYDGDPYLFALATFLAGGLTVAVGVIGLVAALKGTSARVLAGIVISIVVAAAAVWVALETLRTFKWA